MKRYDLHNHTNYSLCSNMSPKLLLKTAKKRGLNGIAVTDHNQIKGALEVKRLNKDKNFEVIVGSEIDINGGHLLALYINKIPKFKSFLDLIDEIKKQNGLAIMAHPYDITRNYFKHEFILKNLKHLNAIEIYNSREIFSIFNNKTKKLNKKFGLPVVGGSDAHFAFEVGRTVTLFEGDFRKALKRRKTVVVGNNIYGAFGHLFTRVNKFVRRVKL